MQGHTEAPVPADRPADARAEIAAALLDEVEYGLLVCDEHATVHYANHAAQQEIAAQRLLRWHGARLHVSAGDIGDFDAALRQAVQRGRRCLVRLGSGSDTLWVSVLPFQPPGAVVRRALVVVGRRQPCSDLGLELLAAAHGLTSAERRVLGALVRQCTPREIATAHAVRLSTVRTQIASLRTKCGARSIEDLLLRTAQVPPVASAVRLVGQPRAFPFGPSPMPVAA